VINNYAYVKRLTREKVLGVIERHSYSPHFSAQILAGKRSNTIGLFFLTDANVAPKGRLEDTHVNFMIGRVIHTAMARGYFVLVSQVPDLGKPAELKRIKNMFIQSRIDGGIFIGFPNECSLVENLVSLGFAIGVFDQRLPGKETNRIVVRMDHAGFAVMLKQVGDMGHRNFMFVGSDMKTRCGVDIFKIVRRAAAANRMEITDEHMLNAAQMSGMAAAETMAGFLRLRMPVPPCVLCANDVMAFGVVEVLRENGYRVPEDVSVTGSDDILVCRYFNPPLTTIRYDFEGMLETLTSKVIDCVEHPFSRQYKETYPGKLVMRDSLLPPGKAGRDRRKGGRRAVKTE
jgi:LacI family transcriptional regulator